MSNEINKEYKPISKINVLGNWKPSNRNLPINELYKEYMRTTKKTIPFMTFKESYKKI
jgi:hypothetical protein